MNKFSEQRSAVFTSVLTSARLGAQRFSPRCLLSFSSALSVPHLGGQDCQAQGR